MAIAGACVEAVAGVDGSHAQGVGDGDAVEALVAEELVHLRHEAGGLVAPDLAGT